MTTPEHAARARAALAALPAEERQRIVRRAAEASGRARRQLADETVTVTIRIRPAHALTPEQLAAWRSFWRAVLTAEPELPALSREEGRGDA